MRELKGDWKDLFNGFMLGLDLRKMFLGFCGILFTVFLPLAGTCLLGNMLDRYYVEPPETFAIGDIAETVCQSWHVIYTGTYDPLTKTGFQTNWLIGVGYSIGFLLLVFAIWAYFGGAIARIAAYEIAKDGERIETGRALRFASLRSKFWSFYMAPWICIIGFLFFAFCNFAGGAIGRLLDFAWVGGPIVALLLPLALLSGFIMTLIAVGTAAGYPLFTPAVAVEGTDAFDAVSRGFSYVYSRPWHYLWYQTVASVYGVIASAFVIVFAIALCHFGLQAGAAGFDSFGVRKAAAAPKPEDKEAYAKYQELKAKNPQEWEKTYGEKHDRFKDIVDSAWAMILDQEYSGSKYRWTPRAILQDPNPYGRLMNAANGIVEPNHSMTVHALSTGHKVAAWIVMAVLVLTLGLALGYLPSYFISQQTMIYYLLRKKVDGIEMNEVFEEPEEETAAEGAPAAEKPAGEKPAEAAGEKKAEKAPEKKT